MSSASAPLPAHHHAEPGPLARRLGYLGLLPFIAGALFVWLLGTRMMMTRSSSWCVASPPTLHWWCPSWAGCTGEC